MSPAASDFVSNIECFSGFAELYDRYRPDPPAVMSELLVQFARITAPGLVVDLGSGTGRSTRYWAKRAREVIGIEPTADMRRQAESDTTVANISYREGFSHATGLPAHCADIVSCSQSLHWMEPQSTFEEARRILVPGGVFAANDYEWPPTIGVWEVEAVFRTCWRRARALEKELRLDADLQQWDKSGHLARMEASGCFRYASEITLHQCEQGNAERIVGVFLSQGFVAGLLKRGVSEQDIGIDRLRAVAADLMGEVPRPWTWSASVRIGLV
jgi:SAM-dependent methyltransferase